MTLKLNKEVTREQLEELGFYYNKGNGNIYLYEVRNAVVRIDIIRKKIVIGGEYVMNEIPTIIKTMIERGYC